MNKSTLALALAGALSVLATGCASTGGPYYDRGYDRGYDRHSSQPAPEYRRQGVQAVYYGRVESLRYVSLGSNGPGAGAVLGAIIGGVLGNQIGSGSGRDLATVGGAVAGGVVGHRVEQNRRGDGTGLEIVVRLDDGRRAVVVQRDDVYVREGDRVKIVGQGSNARVVPAY